MKKRMAMVAAVCMALANTTPVFADQPKAIGKTSVVNTVVKIDGASIAACHYNGYIYVAAEDLQAYGFSVKEDLSRNLLFLTVPKDRTASAASKSAIVFSEKEEDVYATDTQILFDGLSIYRNEKAPTAICVKGKTMILLRMIGEYFGTLRWSPSTKVAELSVDDPTLPKSLTFQKKENAEDILLWTADDKELQLLLGEKNTVILRDKERDTVFSYPWKNSIHGVPEIYYHDFDQDGEKEILMENLSYFGPGTGTSNIYFFDFREGKPQGIEIKDEDIQKYMTENISFTSDAKRNVLTMRCQQDVYTIPLEDGAVLERIHFAKKSLFVQDDKLFFTVPIEVEYEKRAPIYTGYDAILQLKYKKDFRYAFQSIVLHDTLGN